MKRYTLKLLSIFMILCIMSTLCTLFTASASTTKIDPELEKYVTKVADLDESTINELRDDFLYHYLCMHKSSLIYEDDTDGTYFKNYDEYYQAYSSYPIRLSNIYGPFNGAYVFFIWSAAFAVNSALGATFAGNYTFPVSASNTYYVAWKDGKMQKLTNAYYNGIITDADLDILAKLIKGTKKLTDEQRATREEALKSDYNSNIEEIKTAYLKYYKDTHNDLPDDFSKYTMLDVVTQMQTKIYLNDSNNETHRVLLLYLRGDFEESSEESGTEIIGDFVFLQRYKNTRYLIWKDRKLHTLPEIIAQGYSFHEDELKHLASSNNIVRERLPGETAPPTLTTTTTAVTTTSTLAATSTTLAASTTASSTNTETSPTVPTSTPKENDIPISVILILSALSLVTISFIVIFVIKRVKTN